MLQREWEVREGPEWANSLESADPDDGYFTENLDTARVALARDPYAYSHGLTGKDDDLRVLSLDERRGGYRVTIFIAADRAAAEVELKWVALAEL